MAKKKTTAGDFNMALEIRKLLRGNRTLKAGEVYKALVDQFPKESINKTSCANSLSSARKQLGISRGTKKKVVKRKKPSAAAPTAVDIATLQAAAKLVSEVRNADKAIEAIRQLQTLQIR